MLNTFKRATYTVLFFYFVGMMVILGNGSSFLGRYFENIFNPVANTIGLNTTWNFFSPDPAHIMYIKYFIFFEDEFGQTLKEPIEGTYPEKISQSEDFKLNKKRESYAMRFMAVDRQRLEMFFAPWLCRKHKGASKIQAELIVQRIPSLDQVISIVDKDINAYENLVSQEEISRNVFECHHAG